MSELLLRGATKRYGSVTAADHVSFKACSGRILGLLGPNGAGKTTTIRMIADITAPDEGEITFGGRPVGAWSQAQMGYLPEERGLYKKMKVVDQLRYLAELKGISRSDSKPRISHWLQRLGLEAWAMRKTQELSKGMQQKLQFIATILPEPRLVILDEPFSGLDPVNSELLRDIIGELKADGRTILFASHRMEQVEQLCDDICLVAKGRVVLNGVLRDIKRSYKRDKLALEFGGAAPFLDEMAQAGAFEFLQQNEDLRILKLADGTNAREILERLMALPEVDLWRFELMEPTLTEIFIRAVGANA